MFNNQRARRFDVRQYTVLQLCNTVYIAAPALQNTQIQLLINQKTQLVGSNLKCLRLICISINYCCHSFIFLFIHIL